MCLENKSDFIYPEDFKTVLRNLSEHLEEYEVDEVMNMVRVGEDGLINYREFIPSLFA
jgi:Ca2+-binding EF-hand superfamily protein